jgi:hypothetical protein
LNTSLRHFGSARCGAKPIAPLNIAAASVRQRREPRAHGA